MDRPFSPKFCRKDAFAYFVQQLPILGTTKGLLRATAAIALHALPSSQPAIVEERLEGMSLRVMGRVKSKQVSARLAHLHDVLFAEEKFAGNTDEYYSADNSYLPKVLESKRGLPILLALIYKVVAEKCGLTVEGINSPGHFLVRVKTDEGWMFVDPFFHGQSLSRDEAFTRLEQMSGREVPRDDTYLSPATHAQWVSRILFNLQTLFATQGKQKEVAAMTELQEALADTLH
jgi:regulator of sirC expression with transglutaminase-like and TPR domain